VKIVLKPGHAEVQLAPGSWMDPTRMIQAVSAAGLKPKPGDVRVTAVGTVQRAGDLLLFTLSKMKAPAVLVLRAAEGEKEKALLAELREKTLSPESLIEIEGLWEPCKEDGGSGAIQGGPVGVETSAGDPQSAIRPVGILAVTRWSAVGVNPAGK
jgi:hypothetical protein